MFRGLSMTSRLLRMMGVDIMTFSTARPTPPDEASRRDLLLFRLFPTQSLFSLGL